MIAWNRWIESAEGKRCRHGSAAGQYLENRLYLAFMAGANWKFDERRLKPGLREARA
jgi:hypothetical protein